MTSAELRDLLRGATTRPWERYGWAVLNSDGDPVCRETDVLGEENANLIVALVNHAEAIAELIDAAELLNEEAGCAGGTDDWEEYQITVGVMAKLRSALARVKEGE